MSPAGDRPLLAVRGLAKRFGSRQAVVGVDLEVWPGEVVGIVGESGSGKTTLLGCIAGLLRPDAGEIRFAARDGGSLDLAGAGEAERRRRLAGDLGYVHQNPRDGLRLSVSAGANIGEPLLQAGLRNYGEIRRVAADWLARVEIDPARIDDSPRTFSGGMQQRLQIARTLVTMPRLVLMDEPTGGLDVSVQARLLDQLRGLAAELDLAVLLVTHDLGASRCRLARRSDEPRAGAVRGAHRPRGRGGCRDAAGPRRPHLRSRGRRHSAAGRHGLRRRLSDARPGRAAHRRARPPHRAAAEGALAGALGRRRP
jgi:putative phosphonate transport system ATP-binding protein